ncbi:mitochondrial tRNA-specific 2-thiouridylase 1 [Lingula anatina]|uniref:tRNA-5-taurinomethyluridine 2-sulfurtransferase n=1 Tax=Lingula anatina TaxID=7574 RepID=A0A1S3KBS0_LINAN|nr:mitochondrial tRNA-specific 2-thiouridylase 1 [Lingula anatina]|eukprot:XP_013419706.1 mitochondrial tRNA-specific 2-thiouridylase 1 [Lingula anatina]
MSSLIRRVACGMSGGVDSAVSAFLLKQKGYEVLGVFMKNWDGRDETGFCSADEDREYAQYACSHLDIPFIEVNFEKDYWHNVFCELIEEYENGLTPNPDVLCNKHIKFNKFFNYVREELGADALATGHYAQSSAGPYLENLDTSKGVKLLKAADTLKDQTLFLSQISQKSLQRTMFPLGGLLKTQVKQMAVSAGMEKLAQKKESMGICFIGKRKFQSFLEEYIEPRPGEFIDIETGKVVGSHKGVQFWTVGQRCHLGGMPHAYYVASICPETQQILVAPGSDHPALYTDLFKAGPPHWIHSEPALLQAMHKQECDYLIQKMDSLTRCTLWKPFNGLEELEVHCSRTARAITPGQYAVFYLGDECLGSAKILSTGPSMFDLDNDPKDNDLDPDSHEIVESRV